MAKKLTSPEKEFKQAMQGFFCTGEPETGYWVTFGPKPSVEELQNLGKEWHMFTSAEEIAELDATQDEDYVFLYQYNGEEKNKIKIDRDKRGFLRAVWNNPRIVAMEDNYTGLPREFFDRRKKQQPIAAPI